MRIDQVKGIYPSQDGKIIEVEIEGIRGMFSLEKNDGMYHSHLDRIGEWEVVGGSYDDESMGEEEEVNLIRSINSLVPQIKRMIGR